MKNKIRILFAISLVLTNCSGAENQNKIKSHVIKAAPYYTISSEGDMSILAPENNYSYPIHFFNNSKVPYFNVVDYIKEFIDFSNDFDGMVSYSFQSKENEIVITNNEQNETATLNFNTQTITYSNYAGFLSSNPTQKFSTNFFTNAAEEYFVGESEYELFNKNEYKICLKDYNMKMYFEAGQGYLPLYAIPNLLTSSFFMAVYFNGNRLYILPSFSDNEMMFNYIKQVQEQADQSYIKSKEIMQFNYDLIALTLDNNFGLKERISRVDGRSIKYLKNGAYKTLEPYKEKLMSTEPNVSNDALYELFDKELNDGGHSHYSSLNIFSTKLTNHTRIGEHLHTSQTYKNLIKAREEANLDPTNFVQGSEYSTPTSYYQEIDDVAFITFDDFTAPYDYIHAEDIDDTNYYQTTISLIHYANRKIKENKNIKNVVFDISCNTGGYINACMFAASWVCQGSLTYKAGNTIDKSMYSATVHADVNLNGIFDDGDYLDSSIKTYCIVSNASFSCGNYFPTLLQDNTHTKFIGEKSGGGSCSIVSGYSTALGGTLNLSSMNVFLRKNSTKDNLITNEDGVTPTFYPISSSEDSIKDFFDRNTIVSKIHNDK